MIFAAISLTVILQTLFICLLLYGVIWLVGYFAVPDPLAKIIKVVVWILIAVVILRFVLNLVGVASPI